MNVLVQAAGMAEGGSGPWEEPAAPAEGAQAESQTPEEIEDIDMEDDESLDELGGLTPAMRQRMGPRLWEEASIIGASAVPAPFGWKMSLQRVSEAGDACRRAADRGWLGFARPVGGWL